MAAAGRKVYCQNCGTDTTGAERTFYGNVLCSDACREELSANVYFRDEPPDPKGIWYCPHCGKENPLGDPRKELRPDCTSCSKPLDPASATQPGKKAGCLVLAALPLVGFYAAFM